MQKNHIGFHGDGSYGSVYSYTSTKSRLYVNTEQSETNIQNSNHQSRHVYHTALLKATKSP